MPNKKLESVTNRTKIAVLDFGNKDKLFCSAIAFRSSSATFMKCTIKTDNMAQVDKKFTIN